MNPSILFEVNAGVGVLTLNSPERLNALSQDMILAMRELIEGRRDELRALIVTGAGRAFCSGADLAPDADLEQYAATLAESLKAGINRVILALADAPFPVIAAVNGVVAGAGVGVALAADLVLVSRSTKMVVTFTNLALAMDAGVSWFLAHVLGQKRALALSLLAEPVSSAQMVEWGLAYRCVEDGTVLDEALALAQRLALGPPLALAAQKRQLRQALTSTLADTLAAEADLQQTLMQSDDVKEGLAAFRGKRRPHFQGR